MNAADLLALSPLLVLAATIIVVLLLAAFYRRHNVVMWSSQTGLLLSLASIGLALPHAGQQVTPLLLIDAYGLFFSGLILLATLAVNAMAYGYIARCSSVPEEFYVLTLTSCLGALVLVCSVHFAAFFLGLELLSVSLFGLIAYTNQQWRPLEAGVKYLILAGVSSAFLLFGMALVYGGTGTLEFSQLGNTATMSLEHELFLLAGVALILTGVGFKLSLVPFHMWVADVYEGAPAPVGAFLATVSKGSVFALLLRYFPLANLYDNSSVLWTLSLIAIASMLVGNLLALMQNNLKRLLAYSSVAHLGYLLIIVIAGGDLAIEAGGYYLAAYFVTMLGIFAVITHLSGAEREADNLDDYQGLFWRRPWTAGIFTLMLLSLAGIPVTMGFVAKFYVLAAGVDQAQWLLVASLIIASALGLYYYLRIIIHLFKSAPETGMQTTDHGMGIVVLTSALLLVLLGLFPSPLIELLHLPALAQ